jgi:hypothetical protein
MSKSIGAASAPDGGERLTGAGGVRREAQDRRRALGKNGRFGHMVRWSDGQVIFPLMPVACAQSLASAFCCAGVGEGAG